MYLSVQICRFYSVFHHKLDSNILIDKIPHVTKYKPVQVYIMPHCVDFVFSSEESPKSRHGSTDKIITKGL